MNPWRGYALTLDGVVKAAIDFCQTERVEAFVWFELATGRPVWSAQHPGWLVDERPISLCQVFYRWHGGQPVIQMMRNWRPLPPRW